MLQSTKRRAAAIRGRVPIAAARPNLRSVEAAHIARVATVMAEYREMVTDKVNSILDYVSVPVAPRFDDPHDVIERAFSDLRVRVMTLFDKRKMERLTTESALQISNTNGEQFRRMVRTVIGVDPISSEPWLVDEVNKFVKENVSLIRSVPEKGLPDIEQMLFRESKRRLSPKDMQAKLMEQFDITDQRAELIAIDQVLKFNGSLTEIRQKGLGVKRYTWRTVGDQRVRGNPAGKYPNARPSHYDLDGTVQDWKNPPVSGTKGERLHPGMPIRCRCYAEPIFDNVQSPGAISISPMPATEKPRTPRKESPSNPIITPTVVPTHTMGVRDDAVSYVTDLGKKTGVEHGYCYDAQGNVIATMSGSKNHITFPDEFLEKVKQTPGTTFVHNHPSDSSLSSADLRSMVALKMKDIVASGHAGSLYIASAKEGTTVFKLNAMHKAVDEETYRGGWELVNKAGLDNDTAGKAHYHIVNRVLDQAGIISYRYNLSESAQRAVDAWEAKIKEHMGMTLSQYIDQTVTAVNDRVKDRVF